LRQALLLGMAGMYAFAAVFYWRQNAGDAPGGPVSAVKALWLAMTLFWWFVVPYLLLADRRLSRAAHTGLKAFAASMLLRGAVELVMIYALFNWHCYYGIAHDLATGGLLLFFARRITPRDALDRTLRRH
jgi:branched-subunit amino acid ABC-type transport system permease component